MAWVKMISKTGDVLTIPEPVYENMYKGNDFYSIVPEPSPKTKTENKKEEIKEDVISNAKLNEGNDIGKGTKKTVS